MVGNKTQSPIENMDRPAVKVEFGIFQPIMMARSASNPLGLRAERLGLYAARRSAQPLMVLEDSKIPPVVVVGKFSVLGPLTEAAAAKSEPAPSVILPLAQPVKISTWEPNALRDPRADA